MVDGVQKMYKKNFLTNVIFRIDYPQITEYSQELLKKFQEAIKSEFPILQESPGKIIEFSVGEDQKVEFKDKELLKWTFFSKNKKRIASVEHNNMTLEFLEYDCFESLEKTLKTLLESLKNVFGEIISTRVGLRYVNQISLEEEDTFNFKDYIDDSLTKNLEFIEDKNLSRTISVLEILEGEYSLRFQYGIPNSLYPGKILRKEFVLDIDGYTNDALNQKEVMDKIKEIYNRKIR